MKALASSVLLKFISSFIKHKVNNPIRIFIVLVFTYSNLMAQVSLEWFATYNNGSVDTSMQAIDMDIDNVGNVYVTGNSTGEGTSWDIATIKYDPLGNEEWVSRFNNLDSTLDRPNALVVDDSSNVYVTGSSGSLGMLTLKYNANGVLQWSSSYMSGSLSTSRDVAIDDSGYVYITGQSNTDKFTTIKYDPLGNTMWIALDSSVFGSGSAYITVDTSGCVYVAGRNYDGVVNCIVYKYDHNGVKQWERVYQGSAALGAVPIDLELDDYGNVHVLAAGLNPDGGEYAVLKYSPNGSLQWLTTYQYDTLVNSNIYNTGVPFAFVLDSNNNVFATGQIFSGNCHNDAYTTIKIDVSGSTMWDRIYRNTAYCHEDEPNDICIDNEGYIYITGTSGGDSTGADITTIKYDQFGNKMWVVQYEQTGWQRGYKIAVNSNNDIYVLGQQLETGIHTFLTLKYSQDPIGIAELADNKNWSLYPNPSTNSCVLTFSNPSSRSHRLEIFNSIGNLVAVQNNISTQKLTINSNELGSGVYFFRLISSRDVIVSGSFVVQ